MRPITVVVGPLAAASATALAMSQTVAAGAPIVLNGANAANGVATQDVPRRVAITSAGNDSGNTFTIVGTDRYGNAQREVVTGANASSASSALDYASVNSITPSGATAGNVTVGTTAAASSALVRFDEWAPGTMTAAIEVFGTLGFALEQSFDDPNSPTNPIAPALMTWFPVSTGSASNIVPITNAPIFMRLSTTSGAGYARAVFVQYSSSNVSIDVVRA